MLRKSFITLSLFLLSATGVSASTDDGITSIFYFRDTENGKQSLYKNYQDIDILAPQFYAFNSDGALEIEKVNTEVVNFASSHGVKVMPLVTNKAFSQKGLAILDNQVAQRAAIIALTTEAKKMGYIGYQIDFEQIPVASKDKFSAFVDKLHKGLKENGLILSVAVVAKISDTPSDYKKTLWQDLIGAYDYSALASRSDFISIMSYDDPDSKGPIARYDWLQKVLKYSLAHIPANKVSLGISLYYWKWNTATQKIVSIGGYEGLKTAFVRPGAINGYSPSERAAFTSYSDLGQNYMIWYENSQSFSDKLALIKSNKLHGFSAWVLGLEVPEIFGVF